MDGKEHYKNYLKQFNALEDNELINLFNAEVDKEGWVTARASYLAALHQEFINRDFDYSEIGDKTSMSIKYKIELKDNKKIVIKKG